MLPVLSPSRPSLADVLPSSLAALRGRPNRLELPRLRSVIVILADGLGADLIARHSGHFRFLAPRLAAARGAASTGEGVRATISAVFPSTTAAGISTLCTGVHPGRHGMVGYQVFDPEHDRVVNELTGWDDQMRPEVWQSHETVFERASRHGVPSAAVGQSRYRRSGFTRAVLRGAHYLGAEPLQDRFGEAERFAAHDGPSLVYLYVHELDVAGHAHGSDSLEWCTAAEEVDAAVAELAERVGPGIGVLVTADHGMIDVPRENHVLFDHGSPELLRGVRHIAGEPRCLQLRMEPGSPPSAVQAVAEAWRREEEDAAWVATRDEAIAAGWFGHHVTRQARARLGDVLVAARGPRAYYDSRTATPRSLAMVGQHGSLTAEEMTVPLIRLGAATTTA
jgi:hypothetical protein